MEKLDYRIKLPRVGEPVYFHQLGDVHRESLGCDVMKWRSDIRAIAEARAQGALHFWWGHGDMVNAITAKDRRYDSSAIAPEFRDFEGQSLHQAVVRTLKDELAPIASCGLGIMAGNHELKIAKEHEFNPAEALAEALDLPYLGYSCAIRVTLDASHLPAKKSFPFILFCHHGRGASRTMSGKLLMLLSLRDVCEADVYAVGHVHELLSFARVRTTFSRKGVLKHRAQDVLYLIGGSYLKAYPSYSTPQLKGFDRTRVVRADYAEIQGYPPSPIGHWGFSARVKHYSRKGHSEWGLELRLQDFR